MEGCRSLRFLGILTMGALASHGGPGPVAPVRAWEGTITLPTYAIYGADVNPKFYEFEGTIIYPYTMQDDLGEEKTNRTYKALFLENEYLKVTCLPQIGGRIHSVLDKTTGEEMFHRNDVIKPGLIALRGAWISGGIEWNRGPQGHTVTSFSPVNVVLREHEDGSASLYIGATEMNFRTRWDVKLTLHPGRSYLDETIRIFNPTDGVHSYYFWNNTAFPCKPGTRFIYPMTLGQDHAGTAFFSWPIHEGKDLSWLKNYDEPTSVFAYQCAFDFFGAYDVDDDRGIVQFGDHRVITGKKAWTWGQSGDGIASQRALHDDDSQYIEVQSGPLATQADYGLLGPREEVSWQEWWYPVHGLGDGFEYATKDVAVQTRRFDEDGRQRIEVRVLATGVFPGATIALPHSSSSEAHAVVDLTPDKPALLVCSVPGPGPVNILISDGAGKVLAGFVSPLPIPERKPPERKEAPQSPSAEEWYLQGVKHEEEIARPAAREKYQRALESDPGFTPALRALGVMDLQAALYNSAAERLERALERNPRDGMAWYWLGVARWRQGRREDAIDCGYKAANLLEPPSLGYDLIGRARMAQGKHPEAAEWFERAVRRAPHDVRAKDHWIAALYAAGHTQAATAQAEQLLLEDPLDFAPRAVLALITPDGMGEFIAFMKAVAGRYGLDLVELALFFHDLGLTADALRLLDAAYAEAIPNHIGVLYIGNFKDSRGRPLPWYLLGYLAHCVGEEAEAARYLDHGATIAPDYGFPYQPEFIEVLEYAKGVRPEDPNVSLYLGNLYAGLGRIEDAVAEWERAEAIPEASSVVFRNLGMYAWKKRNDLNQAANYFREATRRRPGDQTLYRDYAKILVAQGKLEEAIEVLEKMPLDHPRRADVTVLLAQTLSDAGYHYDAIKVLAEARLSNWEANTESWRVFSRAHIEWGKEKMNKQRFQEALADFESALTYPENLGVGRPARPQESEALYWKGKALAALGRLAEARAAWNEGANGAESSDRQKEYVALCRQALNETPLPAR